MEVEIRLFAMLRDKLPGDRREHRGRVRLKLESDSSLQDLLDELGIEARMAPLVLVNDVRTTRKPEDRAQLLLSNGDVVSVFPPVGGG